MNPPRLRSFLRPLAIFLATAATAWPQGVFIDRFFDGVVANSDSASGFWTDLHAAPSTTREMYNRLRFHAEGAPATSEVYAGIASAPGWRGNFIQSEKTFSIRGISLGLSPTSALVFALNSRRARENDPSALSDALALRLEQADNRVQLAWKLDLAGPPSNVLLDYNAEAPVLGFILKLDASTYQLTVIHENGRDDLPAAAFPTDWDTAKWDNQGDASLVVRGIRKSNTSGILANQTWIDLVEVGGARLLEPFSDATPASIGSYWPNYWTSVGGGSGGGATETAGRLVLKAGAGTNTSTYLVDTPSHEFGNFTRFPKTYALNGIQLAGDTASAADREFVFAVNSENTAEDSAAASDAFRLRLTGNNNVKLEWKLNTAGAPLNTLVNQTVNGPVTDARLSLDRWRYALTVNYAGGSATFGGLLNRLSWNPALWNDDGVATDIGKSSLLLRANKTGATGTYAQASLASAAVYEPVFASDFEGTNPEADGWIVERYIPPVDNSPRVRVTTDRSLSGAKSLRCEVRRTDGNVSSGKRAEVVRHKIGGQGTERWYSFGMYLENWDPSPYGEIVAQWIQESDIINDGREPEEPAIGPSLTLAIVNDRWVLESRYDPRYITPVGQKQRNALVIYTSPGPVEKNQWVDFVVRVKWSSRESDPDGLIQLWKNGVLIANKTRANCYNNLHDVYFKAGIYRYSWNGSIPPGESPLVQWRVLYLDAVKIADDYPGLGAMRPR